MCQKRENPLCRFFSSLFGKAIPGLSFLARVFSGCATEGVPTRMEQIVRGTPSSNQGVCAFRTSGYTETATPKHKRGRPKGSRNRNKNVVVLSDVLKQLQTMVKGLLQQIGNLIPLRYFVLDGYFGHNNALQMAKQCKLHLISKLRTDAALHLPPTTPYAGKGRPRIYGERLNPRQIDAKYCLSTDTIGNHENRSVSNGSTPQKVRRRAELGLHSQDEPDHETASTRLTFQL